MVCIFYTAFTPVLLTEDSDHVTSMVRDLVLSLHGNPFPQGCSQGWSTLTDCMGLIEQE